MNCKKIQEFLPLYVGDDLKENRAKVVRAHLHSCAECARSAEEYVQSMRLLQLYEPPVVSEAVYESIRQSVLSEIEEASNVPATVPSVSSLFRPSAKWAIASVLLLFVSLLALYFIGNRGNDLYQVAGTQPAEQVAEDQRTDPSVDSPPENAPTPPVNSDERSVVVRPTNSQGGVGRRSGRRISDRSQRSQRGAVAGGPAMRTRPAPVKTPPVTAEVSPGTQLEVRPERDPASSEKTLRVEMQTKDRNIRIIWFSPSRTKPDSKGKSTKGIQEVRSYV